MSTDRTAKKIRGVAGNASMSGAQGPHERHHVGHVAAAQRRPVGQPDVQHLGRQRRRRGERQGKLGELERRMGTWLPLSLSHPAGNRRIVDPLPSRERRHRLRAGPIPLHQLPTTLSRRCVRQVQQKGFRGLAVWWV